MKRLGRKFLWGLGAGLVLGITWWAGSSLYLFDGFPKGVDAWAHMTRVKLIMEHFPQFHWNPYWDSGTPFWIWTYPPLTALFSSVLIKVFSLTIEQGMNLSGMILMLIGALGVYAAGLMISRNVLVAIFVAVLTVTTPAFWSWWGHGGNYARIWGMAFYFWSFAFLVWYLKKPSKGRFLLLVIFTSFALGSHLLYGGLTFLTFGAYLLFAVPGWLRKIYTGAKILIVSLCLSAYWYLPMFSTAKPGGRYVEGAFGSALTFKELFFFDPRNVFFTLPTRFTVILLFALVLGLILLIKKRFSERLVRAVVLGLGLGVLGSLFYILVGNLPGYPEKGYLAVFPPFATLPLLIFFSAYFLAGVLKGLRPRLATALSLLLLVLVLLSFFFDLPFREGSIYDVSRPQVAQRTAQTLVEKLSLTADYRFATDSAFVADWFNYFYPWQPQTRDYIYQGIPYKTWQYFQEYILWTQEERYEESEWILDWYGVRYFTVGFASAATKEDKFLTRKDLFTLKGRDERSGFYTFEYRKAKPILTVSDAWPVLVLGARDDFEILVRNFALKGWGTEKVIPVYGGEDLGKFDFNRVAHFPAVFLYRYPLRGQAEIDWLKEYVKAGGRLVVEAFWEEEAQFWPSWFPLRESQPGEIGEEWEFSEVSKDLGWFSEADFGPPIYSGAPWKLTVAKPTEESQVWLADLDRPLIVRKNFGEGEVIWSGLNLPYHAESYRNEVEAEILGRLLGVPRKNQVTAGVEVVQNEPHYRTWRVSKKARGFVWRESWFPRWELSWTDSQGKEGNLFYYLAGPSLSYFPLPGEATYPLTIKASYRYQASDIMGLGTTVLTFLMLFVWLLEGRIFPPIISRGQKKISRRIAGWWEKEEE